MSKTRKRAQLILDAFAEGCWAGLGDRLRAQLLDACFVYLPLYLILMPLFEKIVHWKVGALIGFSFVALPPLVAVYQTMFIDSANRLTPGRAIAGIAVVDATSGQRIDFGRAYLRCVLSLLGSWLVIPNLMARFTRRKQSIADLLAHTVVVHYKQAAPASPTAGKWYALVGAAVIAPLGALLLLAAFTSPITRDEGIVCALSGSLVISIGLSLLCDVIFITRVYDKDRDLWAALDGPRVDLSRTKFLFVFPEKARYPKTLWAHHNLCRLLHLTWIGFNVAILSAIPNEVTVCLFILIVLGIPFFVLTLRDYGRKIYANQNPSHTMRLVGRALAVPVAALGLLFALLALIWFVTLLNLLVSAAQARSGDGWSIGFGILLAVGLFLYGVRWIRHAVRLFRALKSVLPAP